MFKKFNSMVETKSGHKLKVLKTDGGGEYVSNDFGRFCNQEGITHELLPSYTPQQNGVSKRKNISIMNMVRSRLKGKNFPKELWGETVSTTAYLLNMSPTKKMRRYHRKKLDLN